MAPTIQVKVAKVAFGRFQMIAQIGDTILAHYLLFKPEFKDRVEKQASALERLINEATNPQSVLNMTLWNDGSNLDFKPKMFKPKA